MCNQQLDESTSFTKHPVFTYDESVCLDVRFVWMSGFVWMASMFRTKTDASATSSVIIQWPGNEDHERDVKWILLRSFVKKVTLYVFFKTLGL